MAASLLVCAMALLAMSEVRAEDCEDSVAESMRTELLLQSTAVLAKYAHTHTQGESSWMERESHPVHHTSFLPPCP